VDENHEPSNQVRASNVLWIDEGRGGLPAKSKAQQRFMGAELERKRKGQKTKTSMTAKQLEEFARTKRKGLPSKVKKTKK